MLNKINEINKSTKHGDKKWTVLIPAILTGEGE